MSPKEIMLAIGRPDRNAVDQLLFKMKRKGEVEKTSRGKYALPCKFDQKERSSQEAAYISGENCDPLVLTDLTGDEVEDEL